MFFMNFHESSLWTEDSGAQLIHKFLLVDSNAFVERESWRDSLMDTPTGLVRKSVPNS